MINARSDIVKQLSHDILELQGFKQTGAAQERLSLGNIDRAFPHGKFPLGAVHEFLSSGSEESAATSGFIAALLGSLMEQNGLSLWISQSRKLFPSALPYFGLQPDKFIFVDLPSKIHALWACEEALKCSALTAVVAELSDLDFTFSRRLQLAVEQSRVTGFIIRHHQKKLSTTAAVSRWKIIPLPSYTVDKLPGVGFPQWKVELLRVRNGMPGAWTAVWTCNSLMIRDIPSSSHLDVSAEVRQKAG
jgi:protein ImuA